MNLAMRVAEMTVVTVELPVADATAMLRIRRDELSSRVAFEGTTATVRLAAGDYVLTLDGAVPPGPDARFTVSTDVDVVFLSAGRPVNDVRPLVVGPGRQIVHDDPKDPWPVPPPAVGSYAEAQLLRAVPVSAMIRTLIDAYAGRGGDLGRAVPAIHALLIGIDSYPPGEGAGGAIYRSLHGCVRDIREVEAFLRHHVGVPAARITRLLAPADGGAGADERPTYAGIVAAWRRVMEAASPGDVVYIHYAGHGGRSATLFPGFKSNGLDESIAPCDINDHATGRYLRDVEIAVLLKQMAARGLLTTLVLDSCHSGSATRGVEAQARRGDADDWVPRDAESLDRSAVASRAELEAMAAHLASSPRGIDETWRIDPGGEVSSLTTIIAACRAHEAAYEYAVDGTTRVGVLTHFWLEALRQRGAAMTYRAAYRQVFAQVQALFKGQSPLLLGASDRLVLGTSTLAQPVSIAVLEVHGDEVQLAAGASGLVQVGTRLAVMPGASLPELASLTKLVQIEVTAVEATTCRARVVAGTGKGQPPVTLGSQAVIVTYAPTMRREVRLAPPVPGAPPLSRVERSARDELEKEIAADTTNVIGLATTESAHYQVAIDDGRFVILDPAGIPLPNLRPALGADTPDAPRIVKARLVHLARFHNVQQLTNTDPNSPLAGKLALSLHAESAGRPVEAALPDHPCFARNTAFYLRIGNRSTRPLSLGILTLGPDWSIAYVNRNEPLTLDSGVHVYCRLVALLPAGYEESRDILKVIGTVEQAEFDSLTLRALDQPYTPRKARRSPAQSLDRLMSLMHEPSRATRNVALASSPTFGWSEAQISLSVRG